MTPRLAVADVPRAKFARVKLSRRDANMQIDDKEAAK
jgi:hypothetical protein